MALLGLLPAEVPAQDDVPLRFTVAEGTGGATVELGDVLGEGDLVDAVHSGLPLRIRLLVELWRDEIFDDLKGRFEWRASLVFDPLTGRYRVATGGRSGEEVEVDTLPEARAHLERTLPVPLRPVEEGRYYYLADLTVETLSLSDLQELERWLKGELAPAVSGDKEMGGALARGVGRLVVRMLGLPARRLKVRSPPLIVPPGSSGGG